MNNHNQPQKITRKILDSRDFEHLIRGGTIAIGNAEFACEVEQFGMEYSQEIGSIICKAECGLPGTSVERPFGLKGGSRQRNRTVAHSAPGSCPIPFPINEK